MSFAGNAAESASRGAFSPSVTSEPFGVTRRGEAVCHHTLTGGGLTLRCLDYGGAVQALEVGDRQGRQENVVLGYDTLEEYEHDPVWCGVLCGPVAGRVAGASFELGGRRYVMEANDGAACLHGGARGFSRRVWHGEPFVEGDSAGVRFSLALSPEEDPFPGPRSVRATYTLSPGGVFSLLWEATSPEPMVLAPTFHGYFNLGGPRCPSVEGHRLRLDAERYMPLDEAHLPQLPESVEGTPFDFRTPRLLGDFFRQKHLQVLRGGGSDHAFVFRASEGPQGVLEHPESGRRMELFSHEPCAVFYSGGGLASAPRFSEKRRGAPHLALALEPQWYPNALGLPELPPPVHPSGTSWKSRSTWRFSVMPLEPGS